MTSATLPGAVRATMHIVARVGAGRFALNAADVEEVIDAPDLIPVPNAPPGLAGQFAHRERTVSAFDGGWAFGVVRARRPRESTVLVLRVSGDRLGLVVDDVEDLATVDPDAVRPVPTGVDASGTLVGVCRLDPADRTLVGIVNALTVAVRAWTLAPRVLPEFAVSAAAELPG
ncbi:MAG: chemotaxis protein CheW [Gemmatimonadota bacterium]|nr:chemotaxis protein CheW [Gemmatimonadota bacterium]